MGISFGTLADLGVVRYSLESVILGCFTAIQQGPQTLAFPTPRILMKQSTLECLKPCARGGSRQTHLFGDFRYGLALEEVFPKERLFLLGQLA